jgi:cytochrome bd-type quinol oxidase subunit 2
MGGGLLDLVPIWTVIIGLSVFLYVLLDGFDLGVGILYNFVPEDDKRQVMNSIAPIWDGNETWLILGGVALLSIFPLAFAIIIPAIYFPILLMLLALVFRGSRLSFALSNHGYSASGRAASELALLSRPSRKGRYWAPSSRASMSTAGTSPAPHGIG